MYYECWLSHREAMPPGADHDPAGRCDCRRRVIERFLISTGVATLAFLYR